MKSEEDVRLDDRDDGGDEEEETAHLCVLSDIGKEIQPSILSLPARFTVSFASTSLI